jgi:FtsH-binding integral membrane protein
MTLAPEDQRRVGWRADLIVLAIYALATWLTDAYFMGDTPGYVASIRAHENGGTYIWDNPFWEFGHLLWRPAGHLAFHLLRPLTTLSVGADERLQVTLALMWVNWVAGLACVLLLRRLLSRVAHRTWIVVLLTIIFVMSNAFLDYAQTGCAYVPGLALLLLGLYLLARSSSDSDRAGRWLTLDVLVAGASLAGAVCLWFPYVLVVPAALATPLWLAPSLTDRRAVRSARSLTARCSRISAYTMWQASRRGWRQPDMVTIARGLRA